MNLNLFICAFIFLLFGCHNRIINTEKYLHPNIQQEAKILYEFENLSANSYPVKYLLLEFDSIENKYKHTLLDTDYKLLWSFVELCGENEYQLDELWLDDDNQIVETVYQNAVFPYRCPLNKPFIYSARWTINNEFRCVLNVSKILVKPTKRMTVLGKKQSVIRFEAKEKSTIINPNGEIKNIGGNGNIWTTYALGMGLVNMQLRDDKNKIVYHINLIKIYRGAEIDIEAEKAKNKTNKKL